MENKEKTIEELTELNNTELKWVVWWGIYSVVEKGNEDGETYISVVDRRIYFNDGTSSELFSTDDEAMIEATKILNNKK